MGYVGVPPQSGFITTAKQRITSSTNNYVDLDHSISSLADVIVWVNFVKQSYTNLTLTTSSRITLGATLQNSDIVEISFLGKAVATQNPSTNSVTNDMLVNSSITLNGSAVSLGGSATIGGGKIGQVLQQINATEVSISNDSTTNGVATGLTLAITPSASSSKILVMANIYTNIVDGRGYGIHIMRGGTRVYVTNYQWGDVLVNGTALRSARVWHYLDSPNSSSATTYSINASSESGNTVYFQANNNQSTLTLMEVLA